MTLDTRTAELVAIGAATVANCQFCWNSHADKAAEAGCTQADIEQATATARGVRTGAAGKMDAFLAEHLPESAATTESCAADCGCHS